MLENPVFDSKKTSSDETFSPTLTRRSVLTLGAIAGAVLVLPSLPAHADYNYGDARLLCFLEEVERLQTDFFAKATFSSTVDDMKEKDIEVLNLIAQQDSEQVRWFKAARERDPGTANGTFVPSTHSSSHPIPNYLFSFGSISNRAGLLKMALSIKGAAVGAFHGAVGESNSSDMIQAFAALAGVQGRHLALLSEIAGKSPVVAYESALSKTDVADKFADYGFNREVMA